MAEHIDPRRRAFLLPGARRVASDGTPAARTLHIAPSCMAQQGTECRVCGEACDAGAICFPPRRGGVAVPVLMLERCNGCGDCLAPCPTQALTLT